MDQTPTSVIGAKPIRPRKLTTRAILAGVAAASMLGVSFAVGAATSAGIPADYYDGDSSAITTVTASIRWVPAGVPVEINSLGQISDPSRQSATVTTEKWGDGQVPAHGEAVEEVAPITPDAQAEYLGAWLVSQGGKPIAPSTPGATAYTAGSKLKAGTYAVTLAKYRRQYDIEVIRQADGTLVNTGRITPWPDEDQDGELAVHTATVVTAKDAAAGKVPSSVTAQAACPPLAVCVNGATGGGGASSGPISATVTGSGGSGSGGSGSDSSFCPLCTGTFTGSGGNIGFGTGGTSDSGGRGSGVDAR